MIPAVSTTYRLGLLFEISSHTLFVVPVVEQWSKIAHRLPGKGNQRNAQN